MPQWSRLAIGLALAVALLGFVGFKAYSDKRGPLIQTYGTTYYDGAGPPETPLPCKSEDEIRTAIHQVHAKYDYLKGEELRAFEERAAYRKGLPPLRVDTLYVITEDDKLRDGSFVLFIGLQADCVKTVFSLPTRLYLEIKDPGGAA